MEMPFPSALLLAPFLLALPFASLYLRTPLSSAAVTAPLDTSARGLQPRSGLAGTVTDTLGNVLEDVQVSLVGTPNYAVTDARGAFRLPLAKPGSYTLSMRRLGYDPLTMTFVILQGTPMSVDFELTSEGVRIAPLNIKSERVSPRLRQVGFESRLKSSGAPPSHFVTRAEIEKDHIQSLSYIIDKMGGRAKSCTDPAIFMDGLPYQTFADFGATTIGRSAGVFSTSGATSAAPRTSSPSSGKNSPLESILIRNIEGVEIYTNSSETPAQFKEGLGGQQNNKCVMVIWTRDR
jgi:hypothetical protein